mmetsp:Transcript_14087/g.32618  ORF Transcript_14087/g.32618 Transcript_14087/m.32618 type:complete len:80 (-) Transcript_14087:756-995(-)
MIPAPFSGDISVLNMTVDTAIITTCFTFAAMQRVKGDVNLLAINDEMFSEKELRPLAKTTIAGILFTSGFNSLSQRLII